MNSIIENELPGQQIPRDLLMDMITDQDLAYKLPGYNPTLGDLCEEIGQTQQIYTLSFRTFKQDWAYRGSKPDAINSVASLKAWYKQLDAELYQSLSELSEDDVQNKQIDRGQAFTPSPFVQFQIYREAMFILYGKASVYLKALEKRVPDQWQTEIG